MYGLNNYYTILGINKDASHLDIRKKYLLLSLKYHPDRNRNLTYEEYLKIEDHFKEITQAFSVLSDPQKRKNYDQYLEDISKNKKGNYFFYSYNGDNCNFTVSSTLFGLISKFFTDDQIKNGKIFLKLLRKFVNINNYQCDNLPEMISNYREFFEKKKLEREQREQREKEVKLVREVRKNQMNEIELANSLDNKSSNEPCNESCIKEEKTLSTEFLTENNDRQSDSLISKSYNKQKSQCEPIIYNINVSLADIYNQIPKELKVDRFKICDHCLGKGYLGYGINMSLCHLCKGLMKINEIKSYPIDIREKKIIFHGCGHESVENEIGDLIININSKPDSRYKRINDYDLLFEHHVSLLELYTEINLHLVHLDNKKYLINYSTHTETTNKLIHKRMIRIRDLGLPISNSGRRGDLYVKLFIILPELNKEEISKLETMNFFPIHKNNSKNINQQDIEIDNDCIIEGELLKNEVVF
jgi:DnaJ-class molecular chaperone